MLRRALGTALAVSVLSIPAAASAATYDPEQVDAITGRLARPLDAVSLPAPPADGVSALVSAANDYSKILGFDIDHGPVIRAAKIPNDFAGRVAQVLEAAAACRSARATETGAIGCAEATGDAAAGVVRTGGTAFADVDAWPALYIDGDGGRNVYRHDYAVLIDRGGNDIYDNNAGGNLIDHQRGPAGSAAPIKAPAIGCEQVQGNFPLPTATAHDCIAIPQAVLIDYRAFGSSSNDIYGVPKPPRTSDHNPPASGPRLVDGDCTRDPVVRRIVTNGAGFDGNGLLLDVTGNDLYLGKTSAEGAGHVGGVGVLRDIGGGRDAYVAIRNSQGFSLVGLFGLLQDDGGNDRYYTYMPRPKDPSAKFQEPGSGGVVDDTGVCDNMPRMVQGTALAGGAGVLLDQGGSDVYQGAPPGTQQFNPQVQFFHSSQGFGCDGGIGVMRDSGRSRDTYREGPANRRDGFTTATPEVTCRPAAPGLGVFSDDGP
jgi:hypothetical protein